MRAGRRIGTSWPPCGTRAFTNWRWSATSPATQSRRSMPRTIPTTSRVSARTDVSPCRRDRDSASSTTGISSPGIGRGSMNSPEPQSFDEPSLQATVYRLVRGNIESGNLPPGMPISEYRLAQELALSREPVGRALQQLESDGLIVRDQPRGYRVEGAPRLDGREMPGLEISEDTRELVRGRAEWQKIWNRVQGDLIASMPF